MIRPSFKLALALAVMLWGAAMAGCCTTGPGPDCDRYPERDLPARCARDHWAN